MSSHLFFFFPFFSSLFLFSFLLFLMDQVAGVDKEHLDELAKRTEGFSGRGISKLFISMQGAVYGQREAVLTPELFERVVEWKLKEHVDKQRFKSIEVEQKFNV